MTTTLIVLAQAISVAILLAATRGNNRVLEWSAKPTASAVFLTAGAVRWGPDSLFDTWIVVGLVLGLTGDVLLTGRKTFVPGLAAFLAGHCAYIAAFITVEPISAWPGWMLLPFAVAAATTALWLRPHVGRMRGPVLAYILVISFMSWGGLGLATLGLLPSRVGVAAILFFLSDLAVARHRFVRPAFVNRAIGLPAYYAAQLIFAFTVGCCG